MLIAGKGGNEKANINRKTFENIFEWMNFQKKVMEIKFFNVYFV